MRFEVSRSSVWDDEQSPCPGAIKTTLPSLDRRTFTSPEEFDAKLGNGESGTPRGPWESYGSEHTVLRGPRGGAIGIQRRNPDDRPAWVIELDDLDALLKLADEQDELILTWSHNNESLPKVEIYDDYRE